MKRQIYLLYFASALGIGFGCKTHSQAKVKAEDTENEEIPCIDECDPEHEALRTLWHLETYENVQNYPEFTDDKVEEFVSVDMRDGKSYLDNLPTDGGTYRQAMYSMYNFAFRMFVQNPEIQKEMKTMQITTLSRPQVTVVWRTENEFTFFVGAYAQGFSDLRSLAIFVDVPADYYSDPKKSVDDFYKTTPTKPNSGIRENAGGIRVEPRRIMPLDRDKITPIETMTEEEVGGRWSFDWSNAAYKAIDRPELKKRLDLPVERPVTFYTSRSHNLVIYPFKGILSRKQDPGYDLNKRAGLYYSYYRENENGETVFSIAYFDLEGSPILK
ncbi:MAG: hypothetical protein AB7T49_11510 [Oligoflexales bacterium]